MERLQEEAVRNEIAFAKTLTLVWCIPCVSREGFIYKKLFQWPPIALRRVSNIARLQDEGEDLSEDQRLRTQDSGRILRAALFLSEDAVQPRIRRQVQTLQQVHPCGLLHAYIRNLHTTTLCRQDIMRGEIRGKVLPYTSLGSKVDFCFFMFLILVYFTLSQWMGEWRHSITLEDRRYMYLLLHHGVDVTLPKSLKWTKSKMLHVFIIARVS